MLNTHAKRKIEGGPKLVDVPGKNIVHRLVGLIAKDPEMWMVHNITAFNMSAGN